jgi:uncharacterized protein with GYD domain
MAHYLLQLSYTPQAWAALVEDPQDRGKAIKGPLEKLGGTMVSVWLAFGDADVIGVLNLPDDVSAAAFSMAISAGGACRWVKTTPLMTIAEGMEAMKKAGKCGYKPAHTAAQG